MRIDWGEFKGRERIRTGMRGGGKNGKWPRHLGKRKKKLSDNQDRNLRLSQRAQKKLSDECKKKKKKRRPD